MQLVLDTKGLILTKKRQSFLITAEDGQTKLISPNKITSIAITQNVLLSAEAIRLAVQKQIPILFFDKIGKADARLWSPYFENIATLRRMQVRFCESTEATDWIVDVFLLKTQHQLANLRSLERRRKAQKQALQKAIEQIEFQSRQFETCRGQNINQVRSQLMGMEGNIAKIYFRVVSPSLPKAYQFDKRSRRPAEDMFNATLNYFYGMLYSQVESALFAAGLDPHLGILHTDEYRKPTLAYDLIEIFRPWIDKLLIDLCLDDLLLTSFYSANQHGVFLNKKGKAVIIPRFNTWLRENKRFQENDASMKDHIYQMAGMLARRIRSFESDSNEQLTATTEN